ncbi:hypothetical protein FKM82_015800 [Ascaphus truei]
MVQGNYRLLLLLSGTCNDELLKWQRVLPGHGTFSTGGSCDRFKVPAAKLEGECPSFSLVHDQSLNQGWSNSVLKGHQQVRF